jgi:hypothetical protein
MLAQYPDYLLLAESLPFVRPSPLLDVSLIFSSSKRVSDPAY